MTDRIIRSKELSEILGVSRQTLWIWENQGKLPRRFKLSKNGRAAGWLSSDIEDFIQQRKESSRR